MQILSLKPQFVPKKVNSLGQNEGFDKNISSWICLCQKPSFLFWKHKKISDILAFLA